MLNIPEQLKIQRNKFVVFHIDEAYVTTAFFCQRHYTQVLINGPGLNNVNNITSTCMKVTKPVDKIVSEFIISLGYIKSFVTATSWTPKLRTNWLTYKYSVKQLSKAAVKFIYNQVENFTKKLNNILVLQHFF